MCVTVTPTVTVTRLLLLSAKEEREMGGRGRGGRGVEGTVIGGYYRKMCVYVQCRSPFALEGEGGGG